MIEFLNQGWFGSVVGLLGLIVGVVGLVLYLKSKIGARPMCLLKTLRLLGRSEQRLPPQVQVLFEEANVPRLNLTHVYLWNGGQETIHGSQIVQDDPLRCVFEESDDGGQILKADVANVTRLVNKFVVQVASDQRNEAVLSFDFLDPGDGVRIELLHTSTARYPKVLGTLRGIPRGVILLTGPSRSFFDSLPIIIRKHRLLFYYIALAFGILSIVAGMLPSELLQRFAESLDRKASPGASDSLHALRFAFLITGGLYTLLPVWGLLARRKKYPAALDEDAPLAERHEEEEST
jgi:hypothetical protein